jgi:hypothetical protein
MSCGIQNQVFNQINQVVSFDTKQLCNKSNVVNIESKVSNMMSKLEDINQYESLDIRSVDYVLPVNLINFSEIQYINHVKKYLDYLSNEVHITHKNYRKVDDITDENIKKRYFNNPKYLSYLLDSLNVTNKKIYQIYNLRLSVEQGSVEQGSLEQGSLEQGSLEQGSEFFKKEIKKSIAAASNLVSCSELLHHMITLDKEKILSTRLSRM